MVYGMPCFYLFIFSSMGLLFLSIDIFILLEAYLVISSDQRKLSYKHCRIDISGGGCAGGGRGGGSLFFKERRIRNLFPTFKFHQYLSFQAGLYI